MSLKSLKPLDRLLISKYQLVHCQARDNFCLPLSMDTLSQDVRKRRLHQEILQGDFMLLPL